MFEKLSRRPVRVLAALALALFLGADAMHGEEFYSVGADSEGNSQLFRVDADTGQATAIGPVQASAPRIRSLATHSDGQLYGVATENGVIDLYRIDPETGSIFDIGATVGDLPSPSDLSLASFNGSLILVDGAAFYGVDPATAFTTPPAQLPRVIEALVSRDDQLYAITQDGGQEGLYRIEELDIVEVTLTTLSTFELPDEGILDAAFDADGRLRLVTLGGSIISTVNLGYFRIDDLADPEPVETARATHPFEDMEAGTQNLAKLPAGDPIHQDGFESGDLSAWSVPN